VRISSISKNIRQMAAVAKDLATGRYPRFVYRRSLGTEEIAVFGFHGVEPESFEALLQFLASNGYRSLKAGEICAIMGGHQEPPRTTSVALTFDDGMGSVWAVAFPLLKKYGLTATVFLISEWIREADEYLPNLEDVWDKRATLESVQGRDSGPRPMLTWREARRMHGSGVIDFQSHTATHSLISVGPEILAFVSPELLSHYQPFEFFQTHTRESRPRFEPPALGTPLYRSDSRMSAAPRCLVDDSVAEACARHVEEHGGEGFFGHRAWQAELRAVAADATRGNSHVRYENQRDQRSAILGELTSSRRTIETRLDRGGVEHLCYPWGVGSDIAVAASKEAGYRTNFWGGLDGRFVNRPGDDPYRISRMGEDFAWILPGEGRRSLARLLIKKLRRRAVEGSPYLTH